MAQNRYYSSDLRAVYERITKREEDVKRGLMPVPEKDKPTNPTLIKLREIEENNARFLASMAAFTLDENGDSQTIWLPLWGVQIHTSQSRYKSHTTGLSNTHKGRL